MPLRAELRRCHWQARLWQALRSRPRRCLRLAPVLHRVGRAHAGRDRIGLGCDVRAVRVVRRRRCPQHWLGFQQPDPVGQLRRPRVVARARCYLLLRWPTSDDGCRCVGGAHGAGFHRCFPRRHCSTPGLACCCPVRRSAPRRGGCRDGHRCGPRPGRPNGVRLVHLHPGSHRGLPRRAIHCGLPCCGLRRVHHCARHGSRHHDHREHCGHLLESLAPRSCCVHRVHHGRRGVALRALPWLLLWPPRVQAGPVRARSTRPRRTGS